MTDGDDRGAAIVAAANVLLNIDVEPEDLRSIGEKRASTDYASSNGVHVPTITVYAVRWKRTSLVDCFGDLIQVPPHYHGALDCQKTKESMSAQDILDMEDSIEMLGGWGICCLPYNNDKPLPAPQNGLSSDPPMGIECTEKLLYEELSSRLDTDVNGVCIEAGHRGNAPSVPNQTGDMDRATAEIPQTPPAASRPFPCNTEYTPDAERTRKSRNNKRSSDYRARQKLLKPARKHAKDLEDASWSDKLADPATTESAK